jgi:hypothetical protein
MSLLALQRDFRGWLCGEQDAVAAHIGPNAQEGLHVYQNNYRAQLVACLEESFAQTRAWIGEGPFQAAVVTYIDTNPPSSWTLDAYGRDFPAMLAAQYPNDPEIGELAWLENVLGEAFVGPDAPTMTVADAAKVDWDRAVLHFSPTLDHHPAATNAAAIWSALSQDWMPPATELLPEPGAMLVWRDGQVSRFRTIDQRELHALLLARGGMAFPTLCATLADVYGEHDGIALAGAFLGRWIGDGLIRTVTTSFMENI